MSWERRGVTPGADAASGTFCVAPLVPSSGWDRSVPPPAWAACDNGWAGAASCAAAMARSYGEGEAAAHAPLADCLARLALLNASSAMPSSTGALFYAAGGPLDERATWVATDAAAAAPAVRRAALSYQLPVAPAAYANATVLRFAGFGPDACGACVHTVARHDATVGGAVVLALLIVAAWATALLDADAALMSAMAAEAARNAARLPKGAPEWWHESDASRMLLRLWALVDTGFIAVMDRLRPPKTRREAQERLTWAAEIRLLAGMKRPLESLHKRMAKPMRLTGPERARAMLFAAPRDRSAQPVRRPAR